MTTESPAHCGELVTRIVRTAAGEVAATRQAMLEDLPDGLHQHRTRVRRLRSVLAGFRDVLDEPAVERIRVLYAEWGRQLGVARDLDVLADAAARALEARGVADGPAWDRLVEQPRAEYSRSHARLVELSGLRRARERERLLAEFVAGIEVEDPDGDPAGLVAGALRHEARRVRRRAKALDGTDASIHAVRKAGRRLRYVAEAVRAAAPGIWSDEVSALADAGDSIHDSLGDWRDAVAFAASVEREGVLAGRAGESVEVYDAIVAEVRHVAGDEPPSVAKPLERIREARRALA